MADDSDESDDSYYYPQHEARRESIIEANRPSYVSVCVHVLALFVVPCSNQLLALLLSLLLAE